MRAVVVREWTAFQNLQIEDDWPSPVVSPGMLKIRTQAVGINFALSLRVAGKYQIKPPLPHVPGVELCGVVLEVGDSVDGFSVGDRVVSFVTYGALAEECVALAYRTFRLPDSIAFHEAVGFTTSYMTTFAALVWPQWINLQFGETLLVHGAAGGVGIAAIEIAKILGARVIATCSSNKKMKVCLKHGADHVINYKVDDFREKVLELTGNMGVQAVYDPVGGDVFLQSLRCLAPEGRIVPIGFASGTVPQIPANILLAKNLKVLALNYGYYTGQWGVDPKRHKDMGPHYAPQVRHGMEQIFRWVEQGRIKPEVSRVFAFEDFKDAMATVLSREAVGRVAVVFDQHPVVPDGGFTPNG